MKLEEIKKIVDSVNFSDSARLQLDSLLEAALKRGDLTDEEKRYALKIVDKEIEKGELDMDSLADVAMAFSEMAEDIDIVPEMIGGDINEIEDAVIEDMKKSI